MSPEFKKLSATRIEEFKADFRKRFPGRDAESLTDEDLMREVLNTVGKTGKLGDGVRCVVSVSMLTEGWDAQTVTHILGIRAFGTQLLCEQVWLFSQVLGIVKRWLGECVACKDSTFPQLLLLVENAHRAAEKIHRAIAAASPGERRVRAVLQPYDITGTTAGVTFDANQAALDDGRGPLPHQLRPLRQRLGSEVRPVA